MNWIADTEDDLPGEENRDPRMIGDYVVQQHETVSNDFQYAMSLTGWSLAAGKQIWSVPVPLPDDKSIQADGRGAQGGSDHDDDSMQTMGVSTEGDGSNGVVVCTYGAKKAASGFDPERNLVWAVAFDLAAGTVLWQKEVTGHIEAVDPGTTVFEDPTEVNLMPVGVAAFETKTGRALWKDKSIKLPVEHFASGVLLETNTTGAVIAAYSGDSGKSLWTSSTTGLYYPEALPQGSGRMIAVHDGEYERKLGVELVDLRTGKVVRRLLEGEDVSMVVDDVTGTAILTGGDQPLKGVKISDGSQRWSLKPGQEATPKAAGGGRAWVSRADSAMLDIDPVSGESAEDTSGIIPRFVGVNYWIDEGGRVQPI